MEKILVGKITSPVGLKGEVKVWNYSDRTQIYEETEQFYLGEEIRRLEGFRHQKNMLVMKFEGIDSREDAEKMRDVDIFVTREDLPELEDGQVYLRDLIGMKAVSAGTGTDEGYEGETIGEVIDVIRNSSQDLFKVRTPEGREVLIPGIEPILKEIDADRRIVIMDPPDGLLDL